MRREVPIAITIVVGFFMVLQFFFEGLRLMKDIATEIQQWAIVAAAFAYVLGVANLGRINGRAIRRRDPDWGYRVVLLAGLFGTIGIGLVEFFIHKDLGPGTAYSWIFRHLFEPLQATMFSLLAFFIASAAFRAFRARNLEATLLLAAGVIVMVGRVPVGDLVTDRTISKLPLVRELGDGLASNLQQWLMSVPSTAGLRAIVIGSGLGLVATGMRIILGIDRPYLR